jgi:glycosyltransferase involved in cell wall biosynthesis
MSDTRKSVVVIQEYVPEYRRLFLERLDDALRRDGVDLTVIVGDTPPDAVERRDAVVGGNIVKVPTRFRHIGSRYVGWRSVGLETKRADLVIADQQIRQLETHWLIVRQRFGGVPTALWGHGGSYSGAPNAVDRWFMRRMTNHAHWFFSYTEKGAEAVVADGFPSSRVTAIGNANDTEEMIAWRQQLTESDVAAERRRLDLGDGPVGLYVGALEESKGLRLLLDAGAEITNAIPGFRLVIGGDGDLRDAIADQATGSEWLRYVGRVTGREKALLGVCAKLMLIPARIGLVAVDALALGLPIVTTTVTGHGPEFDFLEADRTMVVTPGGADAYAATVIDLLRADERLSTMARNCTDAADRHTVAEMVRAFSAGIHAALGVARP